MPMARRQSRADCRVSPAAAAPTALGLLLHDGEVKPPRAVRAFGDHELNVA